MVTKTRALTVGALAKATKVNLATVRYYESIELMPSPGRKEGGHRVYGADDIRRLTFVRRARELGFSIEDIRALLKLAEPSHTSCAEVVHIARPHLASVREKLADLARLEDVLSKTIAQCSGEPVPTCPLLDTLGVLHEA